MGNVKDYFTWNKKARFKNWDSEVCTIKKKLNAVNSLKLTPSILTPGSCMVKGVSWSAIMQRKNELYHFLHEIFYVLQFVLLMQTWHIFWGSFFATPKFIFLLLFSLVILYYMICIVASCKAKILKNFSHKIDFVWRAVWWLTSWLFFWFSFWSLIFWEWPFHFVVESWHAFRLMFSDHTSKSDQARQGLYNYRAW